MFASIGAAFRSLRSSAASGVLLTCVLLTLALFAAGVAGLEYLVSLLPQLGWPWINRALAILAPVMMLVLLWLTGGPVAALFAGLFLDKLAGKIEAQDYPADTPAPGLGFWTGLRSGLSLVLLVLGFDIAMLPLSLALPGPGEVLTLFGNGWLLGREYFELVALRHVAPGMARAVRTRHRWRITAGGLLIALLSVVPLINLVAPLFGVALMVHLFKRIQRGAIR